VKIDLAMRHAVVTASTSGIGLAIAVGLARAGASVTINGRNAKGAEDAAAHIRELLPSADVTPVVSDLATADGVSAFINKVPATDILVNNLGIYEEKDFTAIRDADWHRYFETNLMSGIRLSRHYFPLMLKGNWGRVLFISSESAITIPPTRIHYAMTKTAQLALARGLAELTAGTSVTSNSIIVGPTMTEQVEKMIHEKAMGLGISAADVEQQIIDSVRPTSLLKRLATSEEVANMVVYCASDQAAATNGAALRVEGGGIRSIL
jgi:NAD(P)-dependent dehydrogenase (short-subunit alcohol dehydrogenase family)